MTTGPATDIEPLLLPPRGDVTMRRSPAAILVFTHVHIPLLAALTAVSAGIALAIDASMESLDTGTRSALAGGAALYLACVTTAQRETAHGVIRGTEVARTVAVVVLVGLAVFGGALKPAVFVALMATTLVVLVAYKLWSAQSLLRAAA
jgi:low temperature requirement protein LtrA